MMSTPVRTCLPTTSATADSTRAASASASTGTPSSFAYIIRTRSSGRGRLPVCVVRNRSLLLRMVVLERGRVIVAWRRRSARARPADHGPPPGGRQQGGAGLQSAPFSLHTLRMNVLFEDDGQLKAGTLLADH